MRALQEKETELHGQIKMLEKEVSAHKKEVKSRDAAIGEKEKVSIASVVSLFPSLLSIYCSCLPSAPPSPTSLTRSRLVAQTPDTITIGNNIDRKYLS